MVQSVELVLDDVLDREVRSEWALLLEADLPSQARHTGESNAPHVTLGVADNVDDAAEAVLRSVRLGSDETVRLGGLLVFAGRTSVLSRAVVPTQSLLAMQRAVHEALAGMPGQPPTTVPGAWTPHVTLARRLDRAQLAAALVALSGRPSELEGTIAAVRRWDGDARRTWDLAHAR